MKNISENLLKTFFKKASQRLKGEWVLIGGCVPIGLGLGTRSTTDIDFISRKRGDTSEALQLMEVAESVGLPIEAVNQAGAYFLRKVEDYEKHLVVLFKTETFCVFRPDLYLFLKLKISRLSDSDLSDCMAMIEFCKSELSRADQAEIRRILDEEIKKSDSRQDRLRTLRKNV